MLDIRRAGQRARYSAQALVEAFRESPWRSLAWVACATALHYNFETATLAPLTHILGLGYTAMGARPVPLERLTRPLLESLYPLTAFRHDDDRIYVDIPCPSCLIRPLTLPRQYRLGHERPLTVQFFQAASLSHDARGPTAEERWNSAKGII